MARSPYAAVQHSRGKTWNWHRPNGERVPLYGFNEHQLRAIAPAMHAVDIHLKPHHKLDAYVTAQRPGGLLRITGPGGRGFKGRLAALTYTSQYRPLKGRHNKVEISPKVFSHKSPLDPRGVFAHEVGHLVGPGRRAGYNPGHSGMKEFRDSFGYHRSFYHSKHDPTKWSKSASNPLRGHKTRQATNPHEDFAESFRHTLGQPVTTHRANQKQKAYHNTYVDSGRRNYLKTHYIW